jgi:ribosomal protein S18 acetylase RimI-like enzyme
MSIANSISRLAEYYRRHGLAATMRRVGVASKRGLFTSRMVVFYYDLDERRVPEVNTVKALKVERLRTPAELSPKHFEEMTSFWRPKVASRNIYERFKKGASLWLVVCEDELAGYGWTLQGCTMEPYYFPLAKDDVHLFDFHVFPRYRGRGLNPYLIDRILDVLATKCGGRAFIEAAEWNAPQLNSLRKTHFRRLGLVRSFTILGHTFVSWTRNKPAAQMIQGAEPIDQMLQPVMTNEQKNTASGPHDAPAPISPR